MENNFLNIFTSKIELFNYLYKLNNENLIIMSEYNIPISNKYYLTFINGFDEEFKLFFNYIFDKTRTIEMPFSLDESIDTNLEWEQEQFLNINLEESSVNDIDTLIYQFKNIVNESNGQIIVMLDLQYIFDLTEKMQSNGNQTYLIDCILFELKKISISKLLIFNNSNKNNLLFEQFRYILEPGYLNNDFVSNKITVIKNIDEPTENLYWTILSDSSKLEIINEINSPSNKYIFYLGKIEHYEYFVSDITIRDVINSNIFELESKLGFVINPIQKYNFYL